jgi:integrase
MAIYKRKTKEGVTRYQVRVADPTGRWYPAKTFDRLVDAEAYERKLESTRDAGGAAPTQLQKELTLSGYYDLWKQDARTLVHEGWQISRDQMFRDYIKPVLGHRKLREIRPTDIGHTLAKTREMGRKPQMVRHIYNFLHKLFSDAVGYHELVDKTPVLKRDKPQVLHVERNYLSPQEAEKLCERVRNHFLGAAIWIGIYCGLRPSEIQSLRVADIDFEKHEIVIRSAFKRKVNRIEPYPKGKKLGRIPMPKPLRDYLVTKVADRLPDDFAASGEQGRMLQYNVFMKGLKRLCREIGVKPITPHELRHSCSEGWIQRGASQMDVARVLNQKDPRTTERYLHRADERIKAIAHGWEVVMPKPGEEPPKLRVVKG